MNQEQAAMNREQVASGYLSLADLSSGSGLAQICFHPQLPPLLPPGQGLHPAWLGLESPSPPPTPPRGTHHHLLSLKVTTAPELLAAGWRLPMN